MDDASLRCPRCSGAILRHGGLSSARAAGEPVRICGRCTERELVYDHRDERPRAVGEWPLDIETLLVEERELIEMYRRSQLMRIGSEAGARDAASLDSG